MIRSTAGKLLGMVILAAVLGGALAACGTAAGPGRANLPLPPHATALQPAALRSLEAAGPMPAYRLALVLDADKRRLTGQQQVVVPNQSGEPLSEIVFRLYPNLPQYGGKMAVGRVWVDGKRAGTTLRASDTALAVALPQPLAPKASTTISLTFEVDIPVGEGSYVLFGTSQNMWSVPDAYPLLAGHDGSAYREDLAPKHGDAVFAAAARYDVSLTLPPGLVVAATGTVVSDTLRADGQRVVWLSGDGLREFAWFASADYRVGETIAGDTRVLSYYFPGDEAQGQAALAVSAAALGAYAETMTPYPFLEMKVVEGPLAYYGMEYPGLNLIGLDLYREQSDQFEIRLAHEIAHQWWYALVGSDQVSTPWLDEGLAEYSTAIYYQQVYGEAQANTLVNQRWQVPYQVAVDNGFDAVVNQPAAAFGPEYEVIVYGKAALFFHALRQQVGDANFQAILRAYADRFAWRIATPDGLLAVAEATAGQQLDELYTQWILSKQ